MLSQKLYNYLLNANNANYTFDDTMSDYNSSMISERKELQIRAKTMNRREPTLSHNVTLLIECGMVFTVMTIVGFVFYCSQRNFKKRSNIHRRRWLESDANIENYIDGQIYDMNSALDEYQHQPIDLDQDCPPPYDSVVQQSRISSNKKSRNSTKNYQKDKTNLDEMAKSLAKSQSNVRGEFQDNNNSVKNTSEPLIQSCEPISIDAINSEISSLIENGEIASSSSSDRYRFYKDGECTISRKVYNDDLTVDVHNTQLVKTEDEKQTDEQLNINSMKKVEYKNEFVSLDASGLPSYDTALKIQKCGNM